MRKLLITLLICWAAYGHSQDIEAGIFFGGSFYSGDLSPRVLPRYTDFMEPAGGLIARIRGNGVIAGRVSVLYTKLWGDDTKGGAHPHRGLSFETKLLEGSAIAEWYLIPDNYIGDRPKVSPYLMTGITVFHFSPEIELQGQIIDLQSLGTEGQGLPGYEAPYNKTQVAIPYGAGVRFELSKRAALSFEITGRKTFTDHLDDVSGSSVEYQRVYEENGTVAAQLSNPSIDPNNPTSNNRVYTRGGNKFDSYAVFGIGYTFRLSR